MPAVFARSGANIHNIVRRTDRIFIVFNHNERISKIAHSLKRCEQARVIPLVQADARFVKDIQHAHKAGADLRGQADALCFAAGKRCSRAGKRQVIKPHIHKKA